MSHEAEPQQRQSKTFLYLYALAWAGGAIAYVPFLTVLLPVQVADAAGDDAVDWLAYIAFVGAIFASIAHIGFGWLSDKAGTRRVFVAAGLILSCTLLVSVGPVTELPMLLLIVSAWQFGLNLMLAPLAAWAGDCVPDRQKGQATLHSARRWSNGGNFRHNPRSCEWLGPIVARGTDCRSMRSASAGVRTTETVS